jgi:hypothetical protein
MALKLVFPFNLVIIRNIAGTSVTQELVAEASWNGLPLKFSLYPMFAEFKGQRLENNKVVKETYNLKISANRYLAPGPLRHSEVLWACEDELPPQYSGGPGT